MGTQSEHFKKGLTPQEMEKFREVFRQMPDMSHETRARQLKLRFPDVGLHTLENYSRMTLQATETTWALYMEGKVTVGQLDELVSWENGDQDFMAKEMVERKLTVGHLKKVKRIRKEQACGYTEAIAKATGEIPRYQPREQKHKNFDTLLDDIAKASTKWRALMSMAFTLIGQEEAKAGVHAELFRQAFALRHIIGENYDFANSKVTRYFNIIKKKLKAGAETSSEAAQDFTEGDLDGDIARPVEEGVDRKEGAHHEDGPAVPHQPGEGQGEGRIE